MAVYDRWHRARAPAGAGSCQQHGLVPSADHGTGSRWQVRWYDGGGEQRSQNFRLKVGKNPDLHADAFDARMQESRRTGVQFPQEKADPASASVTFAEYAERVRKSRTHDEVTARSLESRLRVHAYEAAGTPGLTVTGRPAIGGRPLSELEAQPLLLQEWISGIRLAPSSAGLVISDATSVFAVALDNGIVGRNPLKAKSISKPEVIREPAVPITAAQVEAAAAAMPARLKAAVYASAGTGMREGETLGIGEEDLDFAGGDIHVTRQVRIIRGRLCFAPVKNRKPHDAPLASALATLITEHMELFPPVAVTLPWRVPEGEPVTERLLFTTPGGQALAARGFIKMWNTARRVAGLPATRKYGFHVLRHTAVSAWLAAGVGIPAVAAWIGDTEQMVYTTYAHMMPGDSDRGRRAMDEFLASVTGSGHARNMHDFTER